MKWEYKTLNFATSGTLAGDTFDPAAFTVALNELGAEGWELVSVFHNTSAARTVHLVAVFKRPAA